MRRLLPLVAVLGALAVPTTSNAAVPCRDKIFNDWYQDGRIASTYPLGCYRDALHHIPTDAKIYSSLADDIRQALQAAIRRSQGQHVPAQVGKGFTFKTRGTKGASLVAAGSHQPPNGSGGAVADTSSSVPLPILLLGGVALALAAAGMIGSGVRYARNRKRG